MEVSQEVKWFSREILKNYDRLRKFIKWAWPLFTLIFLTSSLFGPKIQGGFNHFKYFKNLKSYVN